MKKKKEIETVVLKVTDENLGVNFVHCQREVRLHVALGVKDVEKANRIAHNDVQGFVAVDVKDCRGRNQVGTKLSPVGCEVQRYL